MFIFCSCSIFKTLPCLLNVCSLLLTCLLFTSDLVNNYNSLFGLNACKRCYFKKLLAAMRYNGVKWDTLTCSYCLWRCERFLVVFLVFSCKLPQACVSMENYHALHIVECFFKATAEADDH